MKKGNTTLFVIIGLVFIILISFLLLSVSQKREDALQGEQQLAKSFSATKTGMLDYLDSCIELSYEAALDQIGLSQDTIESFESVMTGSLLACAVDLKSNFQNQGFSVSEEQPIVNAQIENDAVIVEVKYPLDFEKGDTKFSFDNATKSYPLNSYVNIPNGITSAAVVIVSSDGKATLTIPAQTELKDAAGEPVEKPSIKVVDRNFNSLSNNNVVGETVYEILPDGMSFSKAAKLDILFELEDVLDENNALNARIGYLWEGPNVWLMQETEVNKEGEEFKASTTTTHASEWSILAGLCAADSKTQDEETEGHPFVFNKYQETEFESYIDFSLAENKEIGRCIISDESTGLVGKELNCENSELEQNPLKLTEVVNDENLETAYYNPIVNEVKRNPECEDKILYNVKDVPGDQVCCCSEALGCALRNDKESCLLDPEADSYFSYDELNGSGASSSRVQSFEENCLTGTRPKEAELEGYNNLDCVGGYIEGSNENPIRKVTFVNNGDACILNSVNHVFGGSAQLTLDDTTITYNVVGEIKDCSEGDECTSTQFFSYDGTLLGVYLKKIAVKNSNEDLTASIGDYHFVFTGSNNKVAQRLCFVAGTKILTPDGEKNIEDIKVGDKVLSRNDATGEVEEKAVFDLIRRKSQKLVHVVLEDKTEFQVTPEHPFYVGNGLYEEIGNLNVGDVVYYLNGETLEPLEIIYYKVMEDPNGIPVFNIEVTDNRNYFAENVLVHNYGGQLQCLLDQNLRATQAKLALTYTQPTANLGDCCGGGNYDYTTGVGDKYSCTESGWKPGCKDIKGACNLAGSALCPVGLTLGSDSANPNADNRLYRALGSSGSPGYSVSYYAKQGECCIDPLGSSYKCTETGWGNPEGCSNTADFGLCGTEPWKDYNSYDCSVCINNGAVPITCPTNEYYCIGKVDQNNVLTETPKWVCQKQDWGSLGGSGDSPVCSDPNIVTQGSTQPGPLVSTYWNPNHCGDVASSGIGVGVCEVFEHSCVGGGGSYDALGYGKTIVVREQGLNGEGKTIAYDEFCCNYDCPSYFALNERRIFINGVERGPDYWD